MTEQPKIYFIPGMGADGRLFEGLKREGLDFEVLEFIPAQPGENLKEYALRLARGIDTSRPFVLGGVSLGGVMAVEIAKVKPPKKLILISTVKNSREFPLYFRFLRWLPIHRLFGGKFLRRFSPRASARGLEDWQLKILRDMRREADPEFLEWAIDAVVRWRSSGRPSQFLHLHGRRDWMFPGILVRKCIRIPKGRHVMVVTHAKELVARIRAYLDAPPNKP